MQPNIALDHGVVTVHNESEVVHVMVELTAPPAPATDRAPLDVVVVLDRSGSMNGRPLRAVTEATAELLRRCHADDRIGVVVFGSQAETVLPLAHHDADAGRVLSNVDPRGNTNLSGGWLMAVKMLTDSPRPGAKRRIIVLTDGHVNSGVTGTESLSDMVSTGRANDVSTSFIGLSAGFDETLLEDLAGAGAGNNYFCEGPDEAMQVFIDEFDGLGSVVAQNLSVEVQTSDAVAVVEPMNGFPFANTPTGVTVNVGDAYGCETRSAVFRMSLRPQAATGPLEVARIVVSWTSTIGPIAMHTMTVPVTIVVGEPGVHDSMADPRVTHEVLVLDAAGLRRQARDAADSGCTDDAIALLKGAVERMIAAGATQDAIETVLQEIAMLMQGTWDHMSSKRAHAMSREMMRKRKSTYSEILRDLNLPSGTDTDSGSR